MKKLIYISVILLIATNAIAQNQTFNPLTKHKSLNPIVEKILQRQANMNLAKRSTDVKERVIAASQYFIFPDSVAKVDSSIYKYSGSRGSQFDYYYDYYGGYNTATPFDNIAPMVNNAAFGHSDKQMVECDTFRQWQLLGFTDTIESNAKYDVNNNLINYSYSSVAPHNQYSYYNKYNSDNSVVYNSAYVTMADTDYKRYFIYNSAGQLILDSTAEYYDSVINNSIKYTYVYDSASNLNKIGEYSISRTGMGKKEGYYTFTYDSDNKLKTVTDTSSYDSLTYSPGFNYPTGLYVYAFDSTAKVFVNAIILHLNKSNLPDTIVNIIASLKDTIITAITYDSLNNPIISDIIDKRDTFPAAHYYTNYYYYETYTTTQVPTISQNTDNIKIYPNPATNEIYINLADATKNKQVFVNLINANGQLIRTESLPSNSQTWQTSIADLTPGTYFISVCDRAGNKLHSQAIVKQ